MNAILGNYSLTAALMASAIAMIASIGAARFDSASFHRLARWMFAAMAGCLAVASAALLNAFAQNDFSLAYVASYSEKALPAGYKLSAFWAGQEGSLLFWAAVLVFMAGLFVFTRRKDSSPQQATTLLVLAGVCSFFCAIVLLAGNPFEQLRQVPPDGRGLNPMLQNIGMIAHPPTLFLGYAGYTIPFALMLGSLFSGKSDNNWIALSRRWALISWVFLTIGIVLGAQWAYVELGWGGYWAWDPVENASLLPWLTGTALLHSFFVQQHRNMFKVWNVALAAATFLLCILGTYITRSGVIQSVHSFGESPIGTFFLVFLIASGLLSLVALAIQFSKLSHQPQLQRMVSKEGAVFAGNVLFVIMMLFTLGGTMWPVVARIFDVHKSATAGFYNATVLPLSIAMMLIMGAAPLLTYSGSDSRNLGRRLFVPAFFSLVAAVAVTILVGFSVWTVFATFVITLTVSGIVIDFVAVVRARGRLTEEGVITSAIKALDTNHRRYGGHLAHLGLAMIVAGVVGSSLYATKESLELTTGQSKQVGKYSVSLESVRTIDQPNHTGLEAVVGVVDSAGRRETVTPQIRRYFKSEQNNAEVSFLTGLREDVYVTLLGSDLGQDSEHPEHGAARPVNAAIQVVINPLVLWIWLGGIAMTLGGIWCILPQFTRSTISAATPARELSEVAS